MIYSCCSENLLLLYYQTAPAFNSESTDFYLKNKPPNFVLCNFGVNWTLISYVTERKGWTGTWVKVTSQDRSQQNFDSFVKCDKIETVNGQSQGCFF